MFPSGNKTHFENYGQFTRHQTNIMQQCIKKLRKEVPRALVFNDNTKLSTWQVLDLLSHQWTANNRDQSESSTGVDHRSRPLELEHFLRWDPILMPSQPSPEKTLPSHENKRFREWKSITEASYCWPGRVFRSLSTLRW